MLRHQSSGRATKVAVVIAVTLVVAFGVCSAMYVFADKDTVGLHAQTQPPQASQGVANEQQSAVEGVVAASPVVAEEHDASSAPEQTEPPATEQSAQPVADLQVGWIEGGDGKRYWVKPEDGTLANHEWIEIDGVYQAFDNDGSWVTLGDVIPPNDAQNVAEMSDRQRAVVDACTTTPWPGKALCAAWVSSVFETAGEGSVDGNACDMANAWCDSSDLSTLKPGMILAVPSHGRTENGQIWGHVCIYVGNGLIMDSGTYGVRTSSLGSWLAWFGDLNTPKWGWANGVPLV